MNRQSLDTKQAASATQFERQSDRYGKSHILADTSDVEAALKGISVPAGGTALDIATGGGHTALWLARHGWKVTAGDIAPRPGPAPSRERAVSLLPLDDEDLPLYTVGQVSQLLEIQQAFLRRLDEFSVVRPTRSSGGQRRYTRREILIVSYVVDLVDEGMTLAAIRRVLELEERVKDLEAERAVLRLAIAERDALISRLRGEKS